MGRAEQRAALIIHVRKQEVIVLKYDSFFTKIVF